MSRSTFARRGILAGTAAVAAVALSAGPALAHHCYIPMYSLNGPQSANWMVISAEQGALEIYGVGTGCDAAREAGYAALEDARLPVGIKIKASKTIGDPKDVGRMNPNGANGKGLEYFGAGSTLAFEMVDTYLAGAGSVSCS